MKIGFLVAGIKGLGLLKGLQSLCQISFVSSYANNYNNNFYDEIRNICSANNFLFLEKHSLNAKCFRDVDIVFIAGWQYLIKEVDQRFIVFHDSILPGFRGFSPTVSALISGENYIGVTALKPAEEVDSGEIYEQMSVEISYPIKIKDAYELLSEAYVKLAQIILSKAEKKILSSFPQDESKVTYSIWRDNIDYFIDWQWSAEKIVRFVDAVGWPYEGAKTVYGSRLIHVREVAIVEDKRFVERHPGKIWRLNNSFPEVVCGIGMIRIIKAFDQKGLEVVFDRLRLRLKSE